MEWSLHKWHLFFITMFTINILSRAFLVLNIHLFLPIISLFYLIWLDNNCFLSEWLTRVFNMVIICHHLPFIIFKIISISLVMFWTFSIRWRYSRLLMWGFSCSGSNTRRRLPWLGIWLRNIIKTTWVFIWITNWNVQIINIHCWLLVKFMFGILIILRKGYSYSDSYSINIITVIIAIILELLGRFWSKFRIYVCLILRNSKIFINQTLFIVRNMAHRSLFLWI